MGQHQHDITKKMLETIRSGYLIKENTELPNTTNKENEILILSNGEKQNSELYDYFTKDSEQLINLIPDISFQNYIIYPKKNGSGDIFMSGTINAYDILFRMNKDNSLGLRIESKGSVKLDDNLMESLNKLKSYFDNWQKEWSIELNKESFNNLI